MAVRASAAVETARDGATRRRHHRRGRGQRRRRRRVGRARRVARSARPAPGRAPPAGRRVPEARERARGRRRARRLSRVCQLTIAAARLAVGESGFDRDRDLPRPRSRRRHRARRSSPRRSSSPTATCARGPAGLSPLLFPNTVMNTMAATTAIALGARELSLTLNAPGVAGELASRARRRGGGELDARTPCWPAGVDELDPLVGDVLEVLGDHDVRGEGAAFLMLGSRVVARGSAARRCSVRSTGRRGARSARSRGGSGAARARAPWPRRSTRGQPTRAVGWIYASASGDAARDAWERAVLADALGRASPADVARSARCSGHHAGARRAARGRRRLDRALRPAARRRGRWATRAERSRLVHGLARGGRPRRALVVGLAPWSSHEPSSWSFRSSTRRGRSRGVVTAARAPRAGRRRGRRIRRRQRGGRAGAPAPRWCAIRAVSARPQALRTGVAAARRAGGRGRGHARRRRSARRGRRSRLLLAAAARGSAPVDRWAVGSTRPGTLPSGAPQRGAGRRLLRELGERPAACATPSRAFASTRSRSSTRCARAAAASCSRPRCCWPRRRARLAPCTRCRWRRCRAGRERSRFRPLRDGVAIGAFLARRVGARWAHEGRLIGHDVLGVFDAQRMSSPPRRDAASRRRLQRFAGALGPPSSPPPPAAPSRASVRPGGRRAGAAA